MLGQTTTTVAGAVAVESVTALDITTLIIAVFGALLAMASLAWNIVSHLSSGVRVRARLTCG